MMDDISMSQAVTAILLVKGNTYLGHTTRDADGNIVEHSEPRFEPDPNGSCVGVAPFDVEKMDVTEPLLPYGDYDAAGYLGKVFEMLAPVRPANIPDFKKLVQAGMKDRDEDFLCEYCNSFNCRDCIVQEWKFELKDTEI